MRQMFAAIGRRGAAGQQYAIVVGLVGVVALFSVTMVGSTMKQLFTATGNTITATANRAGAVTGATPLADETPDAFTFAGKNGAVSTLLVSDTVTVAGFDGPLTASASGGGAPKLRIAGGSPVTSGPISPGQTLAVEATTSASYGTPLTATVTLGTHSTGFTVTSAAQDTTPDAFGFTASGGGANAVVVSNTVTPTGYDGPLAVSVSGNGSPKIRIAGGTGVTSGTLSPGQSLAVELTASTTPGATVTATVTLGTVTAGFTVTTSSVTPGTPQYGTELTGNGTAGITRLRYWSAAITGSVVRFEWPIIHTSGATYNGGCSNTNGYWHSLHSGCGNHNGVAGCRNYCAALGMTYNAVNTNCSTGNYPASIPGNVGRNLYATNSSGTPNGQWECYQSSAYIGNGNNMAWCDCNQ